MKKTLTQNQTIIIGNILGKMLAGIHFQWINDKGETLEKILSVKKTFIGFIVPALLDKSLTNKGKDIFGRVYPEENYYPSWSSWIGKR